MRGAKHLLCTTSSCCASSTSDATTTSHESKDAPDILCNCQLTFFVAARIDYINREHKSLRIWKIKKTVFVDILTFLWYLTFIKSHFMTTANCKCGDWGWREVSKVTSGKYGICQQQHGTCWINCSKSETPLHSIQIWFIFTKNSTFNFTFSRLRLYFVN